MLNSADQLKISRVFPLFKTGDKSNFSNYRPVSVLPAFSKLFERAFYNRLSNYLNELNILCKDQYGFRKGYSTSLDSYALNYCFCFDQNLFYMKSYIFWLAIEENVLLVTSYQNLPSVMLVIVLV